MSHIKNAFLPDHQNGIYNGFNGINDKFFVISVLLENSAFNVAEMLRDFFIFFIQLLFRIRNKLVQHQYNFH